MQLFETLVAPKLEKLELCHAEFGPHVLSPLEHPVNLPALRHLVLDYPVMARERANVAPLTQALESLAAGPIERFGLVSWHVGDTAMAACLDALRAGGTVKEISLVNCGMGRRAMQALARLQHVERLSLRDNGRYGLNVKDVATTLQAMPNLRELVLEESEFSQPESVAQLAEALIAAKGLKSVRWPKSPFTDEQVERIMARCDFWE